MSLVLNSEAKKIVSDFNKMVNDIDKMRYDVFNCKDFDETQKRSIEAEIKFSIVIKSTGYYETFFDTLMSNFAKLMCCNIFYNYFTNIFTKNGKSAKPDKMNGIFENLKVEKLGNGKDDKYAVEFKSLSSVYAVRDSIAHGDFEGFQQTYEEICDNCVRAFGYIQNEVVRVLDEKIEGK